MLDTLDNVKIALGIGVTTDDPLLTRLMSGAESFIEHYTGRAFAGGTFTEMHAAGGSLLFVRNFPIESVTTLRVDPTRQFGSETARDSSSFVVHAQRGVIESLTGRFLPSPGSWPEAVQVTYTTATNAVPSAIQEAFSQLIGHWYRQAKTAVNQEYQILTERTDLAGTKTYPWDLARGLRLPPGVLQLLNPFRVVTF